MAWSPNDSAIQVTKSVEEQLQGATNAEQIKEIMRSASLEQNLVTRDWDPNILNPVEPGTAPRGYAKTIVVNGVKTILEGATEEDLLSKETDFYRRTFGQSASTDTRTEQARDAATGRFVEQTQTNEDDQAEIARLADLELKFKRGEISVKDYIQQSGALDEVLAEQGLSVKTLKDVVAEKQDARYQTNWKTATETFIARHPSWPGGDANRDLLGNIIVEQGWINEDPLEALEAAYQHAVANNLLVENPDVVAHQKISSANSLEQIREALGRGRSSGFFGL